MGRRFCGVPLSSVLDVAEVWAEKVSVYFMFKVYKVQNKIQIFNVKKAKSRFKLS